MDPSGTYPKISNNLTKFTPANKCVDFFLFILMSKYVTVLVNTPIAICWVKIKAASKNN